jgi:hypothetical protein
MNMAVLKHCAFGRAEEMLKVERSGCSRIRQGSALTCSSILKYILRKFLLWFTDQLINSVVHNL